MTILIIILAVIVAGVVIASIHGGSSSSLPRTAASAHREQVTYPPRSIKTGICDDDSMEVFIAGLSHHCSSRDIGPFSGMIFPEPDNPADKKAMAIGCHRRKKILGYVPSAILNDYRRWCKREKRACVGFIYWDGEHLSGRCRVYPTVDDADMDLYQADGDAYFKIVADHFGWNLDDY